MANPCDLSQLRPDAENPRELTDTAGAGLRYSLEEFGDISGIVFNDETGELVAGHQRIKTLQADGAVAFERDGDRGWITHPKTGEVFPIRFVRWPREKQRAANLTANNPQIQGHFTHIAIQQIESLAGTPGFTPLRLDELQRDLTKVLAPAPSNDQSGSLVKRFGFPPFSILDARKGEWAERKRAWLSLGIESGKGRDHSLTYDAGRTDPVGAKILAAGPGTSVFDPVLCEMAYRWFSPPTGAVLDPFAGGSVRGIVAAQLGRRYTGVDLRPEQIQQNRENWAAIRGKLAADAIEPRWIVGDSRTIPDLVADAGFDLVFSCPPYADLEVYSDDPNDLSTMDYDDFVEAYRKVIHEAVAKLAEDRFAVFVIGDVRDSRGFYRNFVADTVDAFEDAGAGYYVEAIIANPIGSLAVRAGRQFEISRKLGKAHQQFLVFCKGDPKRATAACGPVEFGIPEPETTAE